MEKETRILLTQLQKLVEKVEKIETIVEGLEAMLINEATTNEETVEVYMDTECYCKHGDLCRNLSCDNYGKIV